MKFECPNCKKSGQVDDSKVPENGIYATCPKCNNKFLVKREAPKDFSFEPVTPVVQQIPNFGSPNAKWWGELTEKKTFPKPYNWLNKKNTLLVFENHLALMPGAEDRSETANMLTSGAFALVGGVIGAARSVKDKISNKLESFDSVRSRDLFNAGNLLWCKKIDAEIWEIQKKRFLGMKTPSHTALYCRFVSLTGIIYYLFPLQETQESFLDPVNSIGCKIVIKANGLSDNEALIAYKNLFKNVHHPPVSESTPEGSALDTRQK